VACTKQISSDLYSNCYCMANRLEPLSLSAETTPNRVRRVQQRVFLPSLFSDTSCSCSLHAPSLFPHMTFAQKMPEYGYLPALSASCISLRQSWHASIHAAITAGPNSQKDQWLCTLNSVGFYTRHGFIWRLWDGGRQVIRPSRRDARRLSVG
jgi:hypothetical protein